ncbi:MAG: glycerol-3-phosphate 1-O-acyltransferase PlsY, partial [Pseudomonadota bacterium]
MPDPISWSTAAPFYLAALIFGYLLGSIPFGLILTRFAGMGDVRDIGSGNIGATNVLRTGNKKIAALTLLGDLLKGTFAVLGAALYGPDPAVIAGFGAFLGHCFPVWLKFKGGKGVATYIGILLGFSWKLVAIFAVGWLLTAAISRYSSLSALIATLMIPVSLFFFGKQIGPWVSSAQLFELFLVLTLILWVRHRENISRLLSGRE